MIRKITLLLVVCFGVSFAAVAQPICGTDPITDSRYANDPVFKQSYDKFNNDVATWLATNPNVNSLVTTNSSGDTIYEVPLVVHVMHTGGAVGSIYNPTDTRINNTIDYVNQVFAATWPSYPNTSNGGTKFPFRFVLAKRSPSCGATGGINRINVLNTTRFTNTGYDYGQHGIKRSASNGAPDTALKSLSIWDHERYYNIWVVNKIDGNDGTSGSFVAGYAYLPPGPADADGTVILATQMNINRITLPHELGHAFNLEHTFKGSAPPSTCPTNTNCNTQGDFVCDTEPHYQYGPSTCYSGQNNPCTSNTYGDATARNIMNYANCQNRFTPGQRSRFVASIVNIRKGFITSSASIPLPTTPLPTVCTPGITNSSNSLNSGVWGVKIYDAQRPYIDLSSSGYNGDGNAQYRDLTCQHQINLKAGQTYNMEISTRFGDSAVVFIDYNNNGNLGDAGERIELTPNSTASLHSTSFTVPLSAVSCAPIRMRVIADRTTSRLDSCSNMVNGQTEDYEVLIFGSNNNTSGSVTISNPPVGGNPSCFGTTLTFKATPGTGLTVLNYQWYINSTPLSGQNADSLMSSVFNDKDTVYVKMFFTALCGQDSVISNKVVVERRTTIPAQVTIGVTGGTNPTCVDDTVTFSVVSNVNPGAAPTYQWRINGVNVPGETGTSFKVYGKIDSFISVQMKSTASAPCVLIDTVASNSIKVDDTTKVPVAQIALTIGTNPGCAGQPLQFTANPTTGGTNPTFQWSVNGTNVTGATGANFNSSTLQNNDKVRVTMTSNSSCAVPATVTSDSIEVIHEKITADIQIAQTLGTNPACEGKNVIFGANTNNAGKSPNFQWYVNGIAIQGATAPIYTTDSLKNTDRITCELIATDSCVANPRDTSNIIVMNITPSFRPKVTVAITAGKNPGCLDSLVEFTATATDLGTNPAFTWLINGFPTIPGSVLSTNSLLDGNVIQVRANQTDNGCYLPDTVFSTPIVMKRSVTPKPPIISLIGNLMYTNFDSSFVWFGPKGQMPDGPKGIAHPDTVGSYYAVTNNNGCWSPPSNILAITLLDISSLDISKMDVYPNPTSDKVILDWNGELVNYEIEVYSSIGQVVLTDKASNVSKKEVQMSSLANGNYFILMKDNEGNTGVIKVTVNK